MLSVALATSLIAVVTGPASTFAVFQTPFDKNLLVNPGAQLGSASDAYHAILVPGWATDGNFTVVKYGTIGFPTVAESNRINGGTQFFASGPKTSGGTCGKAAQTIQIQGRNAAIDSGHIKYVVTARIGTYGTQSDTATFKIVVGPSPQFTSIQGKTQTNTKLVKISHSGMMLAGQRQITLTIGAASAVGYCDAYFDKLSVKIFHI